MSWTLALLLIGLAGASAATVQVQMGNFFFSPANVVIRPGDRVVWNNVSAQNHDSTGSTNLWRSGNVGNGGSYGFTFTNLGYYPYRCVQHSQFPQTGTVSVVSISLASMRRTETNTSFEVRGGRAGLRSVIEAGTNLTSMSQLSTVPFPLSGTINFTNNSALERRFYRARVIP